MIHKIINSDSFSFDTPIAQLMDVHSKGVDSQWMQKRASVLSKEIDSIKPVKGKSHIHLITIGSLESYGANANADGFNQEKGTFILPSPKRGCSSKISLGGGLKEFHKGYLKTGHVYKNHANNKKPEHASGSIIFEAYNEPMSRGELVIQVDNDKWSRELNNLSENKPVYFSQGCSVLEDICSICGHKRKKIEDSCSHISRHKLELTDNGHQVFVINDKPFFHDISGVIKPADKIAFALNKVASEGGIIDGAELALMNNYTPSARFSDNLYGKVFDKYAMLTKLAKMEKDIPCSSSLLDAFSEGSGFKEMPENVLGIIRNNLEGSMQCMGKLKVILPIELFIKLLMGNNHSEEASQVLPAVKSRMPSLFQNMLSGDNVSELLKDSTYDGTPGIFRNIQSTLSSIIGSQGLSEAPVKRRLVVCSMNPRPKRIIIKLAGDHNDAADFIATEYGKYILSFNRHNTDNFTQKLSVLQKLT